MAHFLRMKVLDCITPNTPLLRAIERGRLTLHMTDDLLII